MNHDIMETIRFIQSDLVRYSGKRSIPIFVKTYVCNSTFRCQVAFRLCKSRGD